MSIMCVGSVMCVSVMCICDGCVMCGMFVSVICDV